MFNQEIRVFGLRRSCQHGIINWMLAQKPLKDNTVFLNNQIWDGKPLAREETGFLVQNYEDGDLSVLANQTQSSRNARTGKSVLVVRDAANFFASRVAWKHRSVLT